MHQGGFLAADEGAGAHLDDDVEAEAAAQDVLAQQAVFLGLGNGGLEVLDGQRVLGPDVDVGLGGADGEAAGDHALQQAMRIGFADGAVHEGAGIALVGIADHVLLITGRVEGHLPLLARGEAAAAPAPQAAGDHVLHHLLAGLAMQELVEGRVATPGDVFVDGVEVHEARIGQHPALLQGQEGVLVQVGHLLVSLEAVAAELAQQQVAGDGAGEHLIQQAIHLLGGHVPEGHAGHAGQLDVHHRLFRAEAHAADFIHFRIEVVGGAVGPDLLQGLVGAGAQAAGSRAHIDHGAGDDLAPQRHDQLVELVGGDGLERAALEGFQEFGCRLSGSIPAEAVLEFDTRRWHESAPFLGIPR